MLGVDAAGGGGGDWDSEGTPSSFQANGWPEKLNREVLKKRCIGKWVCCLKGPNVISGPLSKIMDATLCNRTVSLSKSKTPWSGERGVI